MFLMSRIILLVVLIIILLVFFSKLEVVKTYSQKDGNVKGVLVAKGDDENKSGSSGSDSKDSDKKSEDKKSEESKSETETPQGARIETREEPQKQKTEIRFGEGEKIKTRVEEGRTRIDVTSGGVKVRYEIRDGRVTIKAKTQEGEGVPEGELFKITERLDKTGIKIATEGGKLLVARGAVGALSNFPLQVDLNTNQLIASTSAGARVLTTLPDQAVQNMLAANVISRLGPQAVAKGVLQGSVTSVSDIIALGEQNGVPVYEILGLRDQRLLGFIPVTTQVKVTVSAQTGQLISTQQSVLANIIDILSP
ncbi:MAG: Uncharacterized protein G01um10147_825 [Microgenomates group bacterium Gr01-1014_7]|nr:MAG: Uncharacterized protein G01um10147_825 [Microgenomates group bacterium Gr01-1014_7]